MCDSTEIKPANTGRHNIRTDVTFGGAYFGKMVAEHQGCHSIAAAEIKR